MAEQAALPWQYQQKRLGSTHNGSEDSGGLVRYYSLILGFGYLEYRNACGVQREGTAEIRELNL